MTTDERHAYAMDNSGSAERDRLQLLEGWADPFTIARLTALGVVPGWHCLEIGAGAGSVARWLALHTAPTGHVVATDIDPSLLEVQDRPNLEVRRHDVTKDPLPTAMFDLVHLRLVLEHLPDRPEVLRRLAETLKPGGWLLVEALESGGVATDPSTGPAASLFVDCSARLLQMLGQVGIDACYGRQLFRGFVIAGLDVVGLDALGGVARGGTPLARFWRMTWHQLAGLISASGAISPDRLDAYLALHDDPDFVWVTPCIVAAWGRRSKN